MDEDTNRSLIFNLETNTSTIYATTPNYLTEESKCIKQLEARIINHKVGKVTKAIPKDIQIIPIIAIIGIEIFNVLINQG